MSQPASPPSAPPPQITYYVCDNCPSHPHFLTADQLAQHWALTHTVEMTITETDPWGQRPARTKQLFHTEVTTIG